MLVSLLIEQPFTSIIASDSEASIDNKESNWNILAYDIEYLFDHLCMNDAEIQRFKLYTIIINN